MNDNNPITASIDWLVGQGFDRKQAANICRAIKADTPEKLWQDAPAWIEWSSGVARSNATMTAWSCWQPWG